MIYADDDIRELLSIYVNATMDAVVPEEMPGYDHKYSRRYKRKLKKMMWAEKYFGPHLMAGYVVRRIAIFVLAALSLWGAREVSAKVFGIDPWKAIITFITEGEVNHKTYKELDEEAIVVADVKTVVRDVPLNVPEGFEVVRENVYDRKVYVEWYNNMTHNNIIYDRRWIDFDMAGIEDATYKGISEISIAGYRGICYTDGIDTWIQWEDMLYKHVIEMSDDTYLETAVSMANSIYE